MARLLGMLFGADRSKKTFKSPGGVLVSGWIDVEVGESRHSVHLVENRRPNPVTVDFDSEAESQTVIFSSAGTTDTKWSTNFIANPGDGKGPATVGIAKTKDREESIRTAVAVREATGWHGRRDSNSGHRPAGQASLHIKF
jgi:hypothetical protein